MSLLSIAASQGPGRSDDPSGVGGFLIIVGVIVLVVAIVGLSWYAIGRRTRREDRRGNVHPPDDPRERPPRA